jgi:phosphoglycerate dehydrogenase-like enzyme
MHVLFLDAPIPADEALSLAAAAGLAATPPGAPWADALPTTHAILTWRAPVDAATVEAAKECRAIVILGAGAGPSAPRVDREAARRAGIYVASIPDHATQTWAARAFDLIEQVARPVAQARSGAAGERVAGERDQAIGAPGKTGAAGTGNAGGAPLAGLRLGLIGLGEVGCRVARLAGAAGAELWACDPFCERKNFDVLGVRPAPLEELLGIARVVSLHLTVSPATRGLIDAERLRRMGRGAGFVCVANAALVDPEAVRAALADGRLAAAAFDQEAPLPDALTRRPTPPGLILPDRPLAPTDAERRRLVERALEIARKAVLDEAHPPHLLIDPPCPRPALRPASSSP